MFEISSRLAFRGWKPARRAGWGVAWADGLAAARGIGSGVGDGSSGGGRAIRAGPCVTAAILTMAPGQETGWLTAHEVAALRLDARGG